jgi:hypothetical protein
MGQNDYWRKKIAESKDHAADGKKEFGISNEYKTDIVIRDMGRAAMEDEDLATGAILLATLEITDEDLMAVGKLSESELETLYTPKTPTYLPSS